MKNSKVNQKKMVMSKQDQLPNSPESLKRIRDYIAYNKKETNVSARFDGTFEELIDIVAPPIKRKKKSSPCISDMVQDGEDKQAIY